MHWFALDAAIPARSMLEHCSPSSAFLARVSIYFDVCLPTPLALLSSILGLLSIVSWLFAQLPQIFTNYALGSTSGLSIYFLMEWCLGDTANLLGAIFTRQAAWQITVAGYYVFVDLVLVWQYAWYRRIKPSKQARKLHGRSAIHEMGDGDVSEAGGMDSSPRDAASLSTNVLHTRYLGPNMRAGELDEVKPHSMSSSKPPAFTDEKERPARQANRSALAARPIAAPPRPLSPLVSPRSFLYLSLLCTLAAAQPHRTPIISDSLSHPGESTSAEVAGRILSWSSTLLYLGSRFPQLYQNHVRRSTAGLSAKLFIAAFFGNLFYSSSLLANPCAWSDLPPYGGGGWVGSSGSNRLEWIGRAFPFWLGAAGVLSLDAMMGIQFLKYGKQDEKAVVRDGCGRWRRVTGWMRGWAPRARAVSPSRHIQGEEEALLASNRSGSTYGVA